MVSASKTKTQSELESQLGPSIFDTEDGRRIAQQLEAILSGGLPVSPFQAPLQEALTQPGVISPQEADFIRTVSGISGAATPGRAATAASLKEALAPSISQFRRGRIGALQAALTGAQEAALGQRGLDIGGLAQLAGLAAPQLIAGQVSAGRGGPPSPFGTKAIRDPRTGVDPRRIGGAIKGAFG